MATDYYPTPDAEESPPAATDTASESTEPNPDEQQVGETALVPKSVLAGKELQPGDTVTFTVVHLYDDEIALRPVSESKEEETEPESMSADEEIDSMAGMPMKGRM